MLAGWPPRPPHRFAVGVEDQRRDFAQPVLLHRACQTALQSLNGKRGGHLADEAAGIRKSGLDRHTPAHLRIVAVTGLGEQGIEKPLAVLHCAFGLEQRRNIDLVVDAEQLREKERGEHCLRVFAFGDQHADRRIGIDVVQDLRHGEELAHGGGVLDGERGEIGPQRF